MSAGDARMPLSPEAIERFTGGDRSATLCLLAICQRADASGSAPFHEVALAYRTDYLNALRAEGRNAEVEAGRLSVDEVRDHVAHVVLPRLVAARAIEPLGPLTDSDSRIRLGAGLRALWTADPAVLEHTL